MSTDRVEELFKIFQEAGTQFEKSVRAIAEVFKQVQADSLLPTDENPRLPPNSSFPNRAFPWVIIHTVDISWGKQTAKLLETGFSKTFGHRGTVEVKKIYLGKKDTYIQFFGYWGQDAEKLTFSNENLAEKMGKTFTFVRDNLNLLGENYD